MSQEPGIEGVKQNRFVYVAAGISALGGLLFGYDTGVISGPGPGQVVSTEIIITLGKTPWDGKAGNQPAGETFCLVSPQNRDTHPVQVMFICLASVHDWQCPLPRLPFAGVKGLR